MFFFGGGQIKMAHVTQKKKKKKKKKFRINKKKFILIKKGAQAFGRSFVSKLLMNKIKNQILTQTIRWGNMYPICIKECAPKIFPHSLSLLSFA